MEKVILNIPKCCDQCNASRLINDKCCCGINSRTLDGIKEGYKPEWCPIQYYFQCGYNSCIDDVISKLLPYGCFCVEWNDGMTKEQIAETVLNQAKEQFIDILEELRNAKLN